MAIELTRQEQQLFVEARHYALEHIGPQAGRWEAAGQLPREAVAHAVANGYCGLGVPRHYGGRGLNFLECALIYEGLAHGCAGFAFLLQLHNNITYDIATYFTMSPTVEQLLPDLVSGQKLTAFALTEEASGSDPAMGTSYADLRPDGYHIFGEKAWIANACDADYIVTIVRNGAGQDMIILLVPRDAAGLTVGENRPRLGGNLMSCANLKFADCVVPTDLLVSQDGFKAALKSIDVARVFVPAIAIGLAQRALDLTVEYLGGRVNFGKPIISNQGVQWTLAELTAQVEAGRWLVYRTASVMDSGAKVAIQAALNKLYGPNLAMKVAAECAQLCGANGFARDSEIGRCLAMAKMLQIVDGASEVQKIIIGRQLERAALAPSSLSR